MAAFRFKRLPLILRLVLMFLASGVLWMGIIYGASLLISLGKSAECSNASVTEQLLPPSTYRLEPTAPYMVVSAQLLNTLRGNHKGQVVGYFFPTSGKIAVCEGLTGRALRIVRMHEEAHAAGWRHG